MCPRTPLRGRIRVRSGLWIRARVPGRAERPLRPTVWCTVSPSRRRHRVRLHRRRAVGRRPGPSSCGSTGSTGSAPARGPRSPACSPGAAFRPSAASCGSSPSSASRCSAWWVRERGTPASRPGLARRLRRALRAPRLDLREARADRLGVRGAVPRRADVGVQEAARPGAARARSPTCARSWSATSGGRSSRSSPSSRPSRSPRRRSRRCTRPASSPARRSS